MRRIGDALGAEAMSLYYHVANKNALLDGIVDVLMDELNDIVDRIDLPAGWKAAMRRADPVRPRRSCCGTRWAPRLLRDADDDEPGGRAATTTGWSG